MVFTFLSDPIFSHHFPGEISASATEKPLSVIWGDGGRAALAVADGSPSAWGQATSPHVYEGRWVSLETPRMGKTHKELETRSRVNNSSWHIQTLIMKPQTNIEQRQICYQ